MNFRCTLGNWLMVSPVTSCRVRLDEMRVFLSLRSKECVLMMERSSSPIVATPPSRAQIFAGRLAESRTENEKVMSSAYLVYVQRCLLANAMRSRSIDRQIRLDIYGEVGAPCGNLPA